MEDRKYRQLDTFRCLGFICVLSLHWEWSGRAFADTISIGARALDLFFVISGFLITLILIKSKHKENNTGTSLYKFYARRFLRIFPIYYLFILIVWLFNRGKIADSILWNLTYLSNFYSIKHQTFGGVGHLWSLAVEEQFYFVWPFMILMTNRKYLPYAIIGCIFLSLGIKVYWYVNDYTYWYNMIHPLGVLDSLAIGGLLSYLYYYHQDKLRSWLFNPYITTAIVIQALFCLSCKYIHGLEFIFHIGVRTFWGIFCFWLTGRAVFGFTGITGRFLEFKPFVYIGKISYSMYLFHILVPGMFMGMKYPENIDLRFIFFFGVIVAIGSLSWYLVESPILRLKQRWE
ncbi:MAG: acyltransferase 3 [Bacteroidetes bacterium]|nr:acyltransferase 3 [Bacteroidota bacterium]